MLAEKTERGKELFGELKSASATLETDVAAFSTMASRLDKAWGKAKRNNAGLKEVAGTVADAAEASHDLMRQIGQVVQLCGRAVDLAEQELNANEAEGWAPREVRDAAKALDEARLAAVEQLKCVRYFYRHARWLQERFPDAELRDVAGLVKIVAHGELEKNDWCLTPGRYVGVAIEEEDTDFDFEETLHAIYTESVDLNGQATALGEQIVKNLKALGA